jgi:hypothetical protein
MHFYVAAVLGPNQKEAYGFSKYRKSDASTSPVGPESQANGKEQVLEFVDLC